MNYNTKLISKVRNMKNNNAIEFHDYNKFIYDESHQNWIISPNQEIGNLY